MGKSVVLVGEAQSPNHGDSVICSVARYFYSTILQPNEIYLYDISISRRPISNVLKKIHDKIVLVNSKGLYSAYLRISTFMYFYAKIPYQSTVCFVGGALLQDFFCDAIASILNVSKMKKCTVFFHSVGIGPLSSSNVKKLSALINQARPAYISLRDGYGFFEEYIKYPFSYAPDIAILSNEVYHISLNKEYFGFGVIAPQYYTKSHNSISSKKYIDLCAAKIQEILSHGEKVAIFTNGDYDDYRTSEQLYEIIGPNHNLVLLPRPKTDTELVSYYSMFHSVISSRLHSLILSYAFDIPFIAISWDHKVDSFAKTIHHSSFVYDLTDVQSITLETILYIKKEFHFSKQVKTELRKQIFSQIQSLRQ